MLRLASVIKKHQVQMASQSNFTASFGAVVCGSFNYAFCEGSFSISQKLGMISLIPKKNKSQEHLKNQRPISSLNTDYKIATKTKAARQLLALIFYSHWPCETS